MKPEFEFGDYALIEQKRFGVPNEMFVYKVVSQISSNTRVEVPVTVGKKEEIHSNQSLFVSVFAVVLMKQKSGAIALKTCSIIHGRPANEQHQQTRITAGTDKGD